MSTSTATIDTLQRSLEGRVIGPADDDYDAAREVFYGGIDKRPAAIARVANDDDIRRVIEIARDPDASSPSAPVATASPGTCHVGRRDRAGRPRPERARHRCRRLGRPRQGPGSRRPSTRRRPLPRGSRPASAIRARLGSAASRSAEGSASSCANTGSRSTTCWAPTW